jgi:hypothetical protein
VYEYIPSYVLADFNGDGIVDGKDVLIMTAHWGQDDPLCDLAPPPFGDGIIDAMDLELLMSYWEQPVDDPTLTAHWALDETEGTVAYDSAGVNDGAVTGIPAWQPDGGTIDGALEFDGATFAAAGRVLSPSDGPFSVLAWIKGGTPGQVVISQRDSVGGVDWLLADSVQGRLMTELKYPGRGGCSLCSEIVITDGDWHRLGFIWDGSYRTLYVDDMPVAEDMQKGLADVRGGLYIGCGKDMVPGTFFTGLIDDVRIYNRAVRP